MGNAIEIVGLTKRYRNRRGHTVAVDGLDMEVPEGGVHGFLGPNGSGKTTTIRCLLGLVTPSAGTARVLGEAVPGGLARAMRRTGAIVEAPALFPTFTGRQNLRLLARIDRIGDRRVDEVLDEVGLADRADDPVRRYSLGMRQRLGLAAVLLKDPALVVLDEPVNGLDPAGIQQVRALLRRLGSEGRTVLLSSHILAEVEQTCDVVTIVHRGRCLAQGRVDEVLAAAGRPAELLVRVDDLAAGLACLRRRGFGVERVDGHLMVDLHDDGAEQVTRALAAHDLWITEMQPVRRSLEDLFLQLTSDGEGAHPGTGAAGHPEEVRS
jgi:ABC-type multidrug transport system ATPase subunit